MNAPLFAAFGFAILVAWTFCEMFVVYYRPRWARYVGFSIASLGADLADHYSGIPVDLAGLKVSRLDDSTYLLQTREFGRGGTLTDANLSGLAYAVIEVEGRHWTMDVRASAGYQLVGIGASCAGMWIAVTQPLPMLGRVGVVTWSALALFAVMKWSRTVRERFAMAAQDLSSGHG